MISCFLIQLFIAIAVFVGFFFVGNYVGKEELKETRQKMKTLEKKEDK